MCVRDLCSVMAVLALNSGLLSANLIQNGSFEAPVESGAVIGVTNTVPSDWIVTNSPAANYTNVYVLGADQNTAYQGAQSVLLNSDHLGTVSLAQSFATTTGQTYDLTFALNNETAWAGTNPAVNGTSLGGTGNGDAYFNAIYGYGPTISNPADLSTQVSVSIGNQSGVLFTQSNAGWNVETLLFTATSTTSTLSFTDTTPGGSTYNVYSSPLLDAVSVSATPEPGFYGILALGLSGLALVLRRRRRVCV